MAAQGRALLIVLCVTGGLLLLAALLLPTLRRAHEEARRVRPGITDQYESQASGQVHKSMVAPKSAEPGPATDFDGWDKLDAPIEDIVGDLTTPAPSTAPPKMVAKNSQRPVTTTEPPSNSPVFARDGEKWHKLTRGTYSGSNAQGGSGERRQGRPVAWAGEELWVIVPSEEQPKPVGPQYDTPGTGSMMAK
ncbi:MAG: hypothetical protein NTU94_08135, partial [Planctomycetota bacterium]|nr:hypothetical protein [Planctomycetota bacterium]